MSIEKLIRMANQIASFFRSYPEDQALKGIVGKRLTYRRPIGIAA